MMSGDEHFMPGGDGLDGAGYPTAEPERNFTRDIPRTDAEKRAGYVKSARAWSGYAFEHCETCTNRYKCAKDGCCHHNAAAVHCGECGHFLVNEGVDGMFCRNAECQQSPDWEDDGLYLSPDDEGIVV